MQNSHVFALDATQLAATPEPVGITKLVSRGQEVTVLSHPVSYVFMSILVTCVTCPLSTSFKLSYC